MNKNSKGLNSLILSKYMVNIKPITLEIEKRIWDKFKEITPRIITLNDAIVNLIIKEVNRK